MSFHSKDLNFSLLAKKRKDHTGRDGGPTWAGDDCLVPGPWVASQALEIILGQKPARMAEVEL